MSHDPETPWVAKLHQELRRLPDLPAPPSLIPSVLAALQASAPLPWWRRPWSSWPALPRFAFAGFGILCLTALVYAGFVFEPALARGVATLPASRWVAPVSEFAHVVLSLADAVAVIWHATPQALMIGLLVLASFIYLTCVGLGTAVFRVAWKRI
jgi:hypothetical protein